MRKLHIGGQVRVPGWEVIDANPGTCVDHVGNANDLARFETGTFTQIYASHVLEHFDYRDEVVTTLKEWCRVLIPGGVLNVSVPNLDTLARLYVDRQRLSGSDRFLVMRMIFGGHTDKYDYHLVGFNDELLAYYLFEAGFASVQSVPGFGLFQDTSLTTIHGIPISLNMTATKPTVPESQTASITEPQASRLE